MLVPLGLAKYAIIDDDAWYMVSGVKWSALQASRPKGRYYALGQVGGATIYMHRIIMNAPKGVQVDHINRDGLDNRRNNLRLCDQSHNNANRKPGANISGFRGVHPNMGKWRAVVQFKGHVLRGSQCDSREDAAREYDMMARKAFGEFAVLNFPECI